LTHKTLTQVIFAVADHSILKKMKQLRSQPPTISL
jgi:hypothetical protein